MMRVVWFQCFSLREAIGRGEGKEYEKRDKERRITIYQTSAVDGSVGKAVAHKRRDLVGMALGSLALLHGVFESADSGF